MFVRLLSALTLLAWLLPLQAYAADVRQTVRAAIVANDKFPASLYTDDFVSARKRADAKDTLATESGLTGEAGTARIEIKSMRVVGSHVLVDIFARRDSVALMRKTITFFIAPDGRIADVDTNTRGRYLSASGPIQQMPTLLTQYCDVLDESAKSTDEITPRPTHMKRHNEANDAPSTPTAINCSGSSVVSKVAPESGSDKLVRLLDRTMAGGPSNKVASPQEHVKPQPPSSEFTEAPPKPPLSPRSQNQMASLPSVGEVRDAFPHEAFDQNTIEAMLSHEAAMQKVLTTQPLAKVTGPISTRLKPIPASSATIDEIDSWLIKHYRACWKYQRSDRTEGYIPTVAVLLDRDGALIGAGIVNPTYDPAVRRLADSAIKAVFNCNPLPIPERFKELYSKGYRQRVVRFDPKEANSKTQEDDDNCEKNPTICTDEDYQNTIYSSIRHVLVNEIASNKKIEFDGQAEGRFRFFLDNIGNIKTVILVKSTGSSSQDRLITMSIMLAAPFPNSERARTEGLCLTMAVSDELPTWSGPDHNVQHNLFCNDTEVLSSLYQRTNSIIEATCTQHPDIEACTKNIAVNVTFKLTVNGQVEEPQITRTSGYLDVDNLAVRSLIEASPFPSDGLVVGKKLVFMLYR